MVEAATDSRKKAKNAVKRAKSGNPASRKKMNFFSLVIRVGRLGRQRLSVPSPSVAGLWIAIAAGSIANFQKQRSEDAAADWRSGFDPGAYRGLSGHKEVNERRPWRRLPTAQ